ncbi:MAG: hypothetical protein ACYCUV_04910 [Phycisphaerae bacterium]
MKKNEKPSELEIGAALLAWNKMVAAEHPEGLVTKATAAKMLGISPVAVSRLVARSHLRAVYFPKVPDVEELPIGTDDPIWMKLMSALERVFGRPDGRRWVIPEICYVCLADVEKLWHDAKLQEKCHINWWKVFFTTSKLN